MARVNEIIKKIEQEKRRLHIIQKFKNTTSDWKYKDTPREKIWWIINNKNTNQKSNQNTITKNTEH